MNEKEACLSLCQRLLRQLEEDETQISYAIRGEMLNGYRDTVREEKDKVIYAGSMLQKI